MSESTELFRARSGDTRAFENLVAPHRRELTLHCYRMLGSYSDAEDALQETLISAWKGLARFEGRSSLRAWLYRIATNECLDDIERRRARPLPMTTVPAGDPRQPPPAPALDTPWLEPVPSDLLEPSDLGPEARYSLYEGVALALLATLQLLPGRQRAVLLLRDVLGFSAEETAEIVESSVAAVNSALQRARATLEQEQQTKTQQLAPDDPSALDVVGRFVRAWESGDAAAVVGLLTTEVVFTMPPMPLWFHGREAVQTFLESFLFAERDRERFRTRVSAANGCPAVAIYERDPSGVYQPSALDVLVVTRAGIAEIHAFLGLDPALSFARFGLPPTLG